MGSKAETEQAIETIREYSSDIDRSKKKIKTLGEQAQEVLDGLVAYDEVLKAERALAQAKEGLKNALMNEGQYNNILEEIAQEKEKLRDMKDIMSQHIVFYFKETGDRQIEIDHANGDAREIIVNGRLGAKSKLQTNLFGVNVSMQVGDGPEVPLKEVAKGKKNAKQ